MISESVSPERPGSGESESRALRQAARTRVIGALVVLVSSIAFSTKAILVKLAYRQGIDSVSLLALRFGFSAPFFAYAAFGSRLRGQQPGALARRDTVAIIALGV